MIFLSCFLMEVMNLFAAGQIEPSPPGDIARQTSRKETHSAVPVMTNLQNTEKGDIIYYEGEAHQQWTLPLSEKISVEPYQTLSYSVMTKLEKIDPRGDLFLGVRFFDSAGREMSTLYGARLPDFFSSQWHEVKAVLAAPPGVAGARFQVYGTGNHVLSLDKVTFSKVSLPVAAELHHVPEPISLENDLLKVHFIPDEFRFVAMDKRSSKTWDTFGENQHVKITRVNQTSSLSAIAEGYYLDALAPLKIELRLEQTAPEFSIQTHMSPDTPMAQWAGAFSTAPTFCAPEANHELVVPLGEGFLYPTDNEKIPSHLMQLADGSGLTMPWFGIVDNKTGSAAICWTRNETDALARMYYRQQGEKKAGAVMLDWLPQKNSWGYDRTVTYWFADSGGYVALCKRYREEARATSKLVTFQEKRIQHPEVDRLLGAPNCWFQFFWRVSDKSKRMEYLRWLHDRGIDRMLFCNTDTLDSTDEIISWGYVPSAYDLYSDVWPEEEVEAAQVPGRSYGYPDKVLVRYNGTLQRGWVQKTPAGEFPSYILCTTQQLGWAKERIPLVLSAQKRLAHFFDTTAGLPLYECYSPQHPMTRADDRSARIELFKYAGSLGLLVGSEMGVDWAVPYLAYCEGMMSPVPYRHPEAGYLKQDIKPDNRTYQYQLNPAVRVPLWELVYHDACIAYWYWGDATNTFPELWTLRTLFNALYATPPMYMILKDEELFLKQRDRIVETHLQLKPLFEAVNFSEMVSHAFLSTDRKLQVSKFHNGAEVVVNFSSEPRRYRDTEIPAQSFKVFVP